MNNKRFISMMWQAFLRTLKNPNGQVTLDMVSDSETFVTKPEFKEFISIFVPKIDDKEVNDTFRSCLPKKSSVN